MSLEPRPDPPTAGSASGRHVAYVDDVDYVARWSALVRAREDQGRRLDRFHTRDDHWEGQRAQRFRRMAESGGPDPLFELIRPSLTPGTTVLDVGAGAGRHVSRIAPLVRRVTAVEPSAAMREQLADVVREASLSNVDVVVGAWPNVDVGPADVVICSHVAYFVQEIVPFIERLRAVNRGHAYVVHRFVQRESAILDVFARVWNESRCPEPSFVDLYGAAAQLGLWGNVATIRFGFAPTFASIDEAVQMVQAELLNPTAPRAMDLIRADLQERLVARDGRFGFDRPPTFAGVLWWEAGR